jgi:hypothetical protein
MISTQHCNTLLNDHVGSRNIPPIACSKKHNSTMKPTQQTSPTPKFSEEEKEKIILFSKVLMKYLKVTDASMHLKAQKTIRECVQKHDDGIPGYEALEAAIQLSLHETVGNFFWGKAEKHLASYLRNQQRKRSLSNMMEFSSSHVKALQSNNKKRKLGETSINNGWNNDMNVKSYRKSSSKTVKFDKIQIREYALTVGDNPSCSNAPISLSWEYNPAHEVHTIDEYEQQHPERKNVKRWNSIDRLRILMQWDVPYAKITEASKECKHIQEQRAETIESFIRHN